MMPSTDEVMGAWRVVMWTIATITAFGGAAMVVAKAYRYIRKPFSDFGEDIERLEGYLARDKNRLEVMERVVSTQSEQNDLMLRALVKIIDKEVSGGNPDDLREVRDEIQEYLMRNVSRKDDILK